MNQEKLRLDKYLWAIRIYKTRTLAATAIDAGKVKCQGNDVKPAKQVSIGDQYEIKTEGRNWIIEVTALLDKRLQYAEVVNYYLDKTPVEDNLKKDKSVFVEYTGKRQSKQGRPTKKNRRELDSLGDFL
jgi:ribosome-associated heat shock protein Hsp15